MQRTLRAFATNPSRTTFLAAFKALSRSSPVLSAADVARLASLVETQDRGDFNEALAGISSLSALSPAVHALAAESARAAGDDADGELEEFLLAACLHAILETGDGTAEAPYLVVCTADERYVCQALDLEPGPQALINASGTSLDVVQCLDGTDVWFAVSHLAPVPEPQPLTRRAAKCASRPRRRLSQSRR